MADFCNQCAGPMGFGGDFAGITTDAEWRDGRAAGVLCEGCGPIRVDPAGNCVSPDCLHRHGVPPKSNTPEADRVRRLLLRIDHVVNRAADETIVHAPLATLLEAEEVVEDLGMRLGLVPRPQTRRAGDIKPAWPARQIGTMDRFALAIGDLLDAFIVAGAMPDVLAEALQFEADRLMELDAKKGETS
jgi:hypothetical protein